MIEGIILTSLVVFLIVLALSGTLKEATWCAALSMPLFYIMATWLTLFFGKAA